MCGKVSLHCSSPLLLSILITNLVNRMMLFGLGVAQAAVAEAVGDARLP